MTRRRSIRRRNGREPVSTRSALRFRLLLATFGAVLSIAVAVIAFSWEDPPTDVVVLGSGFAMLAVVALIDIIVVLVRMGTDETEVARRSRRRMRRSAP